MPKKLGFSEWIYLLIYTVIIHLEKLHMWTSQVWDACSPEPDLPVLPLCTFCCCSSIPSLLRPRSPRGWCCLAFIFLIMPSTVCALAFIPSSVKEGIKASNRLLNNQTKTVTLQESYYHRNGYIPLETQLTVRSGWACPDSHLMETKCKYLRPSIWNI